MRMGGSSTAELARNDAAAARNGRTAFAFWGRTWKKNAQTVGYSCSDCCGEHSVKVLLENRPHRTRISFGTKGGDDDTLKAEVGTEENEAAGAARTAKATRDAAIQGDEGMI